MSRSEADGLLAQAQGAKGKDNETSLLLYQESLKIYLDLYKVEANDKAKTDLLAIIEGNMKAAEDLKKKMNEQQKATTSIFSFGLAKPNKPASKPEKQQKATVPNTPDYHDYSNINKGTPRSNRPSISSTTKTPRKAATPRFNTSTSTTTTTNSTSTRRGGGTPSSTSSAPPPNEYEQQLMSDILDTSPGVYWDDISGLAFAKQTLQEAVILPNLRPDLFTGLRSPPKGVLLFGPPGTGKTLLAKAVATESGFCFLSITSSSVTSKFMGDGEKLMKVYGRGRGRGMGRGRGRGRDKEGYRGGKWVMLSIGLYCICYT